MQKDPNRLGRGAKRSLSAECALHHLRDETEWVETVEDGWNVLAGPDKDEIVRLARDFEPSQEQRDVFGKGNASAKTAELIEMLASGSLEGARS